VISRTGIGMKKRAGNDDGEIPCNREEREREIEREGKKERRREEGQNGSSL